MNVTLVNGSQRFDGHTVLFHDFLDALKGQGVVPRVYTCVDPSSAAEFAEDGERIVGRRFPGGGLGEMAFNRLFPILARRVARVPGDLVHVNDAYLARAARYTDRLVATLVDLGKLTTHHYPRLHSWVHNVNLRAAVRCRGIVCCSEFVQREITTTLGIEPSRVRVVPLYSRLPRSPRPTEPPSPPTTASPWTLLCVSTDRPHKNIRLFLEVLSRLDSRFRGHLISKIGPETSQRIASLNLGPRLTVEHGLSDTTEAYRSSHLLVFPSLFEGFGIPLVEAMSQGRPILASSLSSTPGVVGGGGQLLDPRESGPWVEAIQRLTDPSVYLASAQRSWERGGEFTAQRTGTELLAAYRTFSDLGPVR